MGLLPKPTQNQLFGALRSASARRPECPCKVPDSKRSSTMGILKSYRNHISRLPGNHTISIFKPSKKQTSFFGCSIGKWASQFEKLLEILGPSL